MYHARVRHPGALQGISADICADGRLAPPCRDCHRHLVQPRRDESQAFSRKLRSFNVPATNHARARAPSTPVARKRDESGAGLRRTEAPASDPVAGAIYHLTDKMWIIPALEAAMAGTAIGLVFDADDPAASANARTR